MRARPVVLGAVAVALGLVALKYGSVTLPWALEEGPQLLALQQTAYDSLPLLADPSGQPPVSGWKTAEREHYSKLLGTGPFEVLIAPFYAGEPALDRAARSYMTARLAQIVAGKQKTPDPYLVARVLGDGVRGVKVDDVYALVNTVKAKRLVWAAVSYAQNPERLRVAVQYQDRSWRGALDYDTTPETREFEAPMSEDISYVDAFERVLPEIAQFLGFDVPAATAAAGNAPPTATPLPDVPSALLAAGGTAAKDAL